jgi:hypothetical protein
MGLIQFSEQKICPRCHGKSVHRSHRRGAVERVVCALLLISPFRCDDCDHRYFRFRPVRETQAHRHA